MNSRNPSGVQPEYVEECKVLLVVVRVGVIVGLVVVHMLWLVVVCGGGCDQLVMVVGGGCCW